jgi:hypothetical protein
MGSLADLPYALAETEQDFIAPENVQALIWKELVPDLLVSATVPRWWSVTPHELHAVALYQRSGEELLLASERDATLRQQVIDVLGNRMAPQRLETLEKSLVNNEDSRISNWMPCARQILLRRRSTGFHATLAFRILCLRAAMLRVCSRSNRSHPSVVSPAASLGSRGSRATCTGRGLPMKKDMSRQRSIGWCQS